MANRGRHLAPRRRRISRTWVIPLTLVMSLVWSGVAIASDVDVAVVDVTAPTGSVTLAPGATGAITINMSVSGNQAGTATFEVYRNWTLSGGTFTGSNPQEFTVGPRAGGDPATTFSTTGSVTVASGHAAAIFTLAVEAFDITNSNATGAKLAAGDSSNYLVTVSSPPTPSDTTPPAISYDLDPAEPDGANGWYVSDVDVDWTVIDPQSTFTSTGCDDTTLASDTTGTTYTCSATSAGGTASVTTIEIKRDATDPVVMLNGGPEDGANYYFGFVPPEPTCSASDATSDLAAPCSVSDYSGAVGTHTVSANATDNAGNEGRASRTYTVLAWTLNGFYQPVDMDKVNTVKGGSTVPLKFEAFAGSTELTDVPVVDAFIVKKVSCTTFNGEPIDDIELTTTGGTVLRYDWTAGQFIQNWQTPKGAGLCYTVMMTTDDGSYIGPASFKTK